MDKFEITRAAVREIPPAAGRSLLDVGCRDCILKTHLDDAWTYSGLDLFQNKRNSVTFVQSVEDGIPVADRHFTVVTALDVIEHVDKMSQVMDELWRVTGNTLIVALPNMAYFIYRISFMFSGLMGDKYKMLPYGKDEGDRHRWMTTASESIRYMQEFAAANGPHIKLSWQATAETRKRKLFSKALKAVGFSEQIHAPTLVFVLERAD